jgi:adenine-specific DNA-methyltransferase
MGARYPYYFLADSVEGQQKEGEVSRTLPSTQPVSGNIRQGFVYERVPQVTLQSFTKNAEIDVIWEAYQAKLEPLRTKLNEALKTTWEEWEIPRSAEEKWGVGVKDLHAEWWKLRIARQSAIDTSISAKADSEFLYDKPYEDKRKVRVAGPFTVESLTPHRILAVGADEELMEATGISEEDVRSARNFAQLILENLKTSGVQQAHKCSARAFVPERLLV